MCPLGQMKFNPAEKDFCFQLALIETNLVSFFPPAAPRRAGEAALAYG